MTHIDNMTRALEDCDCSETTAKEIAYLVERGDKARALERIASHRSDLLSTFHRCDSCISRIDYIASEIIRRNWEEER